MALLKRGGRSARRSFFFRSSLGNDETRNMQLRIRRYLPLERDMPSSIQSRERVCFDRVATETHIGDRRNAGGLQDSHVNF